MTWPPGIRARNARASDAAAVTEMLRGAERVDLGEALVDEDDVAGEWRRPGFDLARDTRLFHADERLVGYAHVFAGRAQARVAPAMRGRGLGSAVLTWTEERAREQAAASGQPPRVGQTVCDRSSDAVELLVSHGYAPVYESWVLRLPSDAAPAATAPDGVRIRPCRTDDERAAFEVIEAGFSEFAGRTPSTFETWRSLWLGRTDFDPGLLLLAEREGAEPACIGAVLAYAYPDEGWVQQLAVARSERGRGIAWALLAGIFAELRRRGAPRLGLNTDSRTGALGLYTGLGMRVELSFTHRAKDL